MKKLHTRKERRNEVCAYVRDADDENRQIMTVTLFQRLPLFDAYLAPSQNVLVDERDYG